MSCVGSVVVFLHAHVFLAMEDIFDVPMVANGLSRQRRWHALPGSVGDGVDGFVGGMPGAMIDALAFDAEDLLDVGEGCAGRIVGIDV